MYTCRVNAATVSSQGWKIFAGPGVSQFSEHKANETQPAIPYSEYCLLEEAARQWGLRL